MKKNKNAIYVYIIFLITIILFIKLFVLDRYQGHDTIFHVTNIIELSKTISLDNMFGSNIITYNANKFGYGIWLFYPKLPHLIAAYMYLLTKDIYLTMKIIYFITTFLSGVFTYFLSKKIFNNNKIALLSSVIYLTIPYHMCEIYIRDAFAENFIFLVLPMIFLGLYNLKENNYKKFYILFILGYLIGMNSHLISMVFYTIFVAIFILYYRRDFLKKEKLKALMISTLLVTGITLPFLTTIIEHKLLNLYTVFTDSFSNLYSVQLSSLEFKSLFNQEQIYNKIEPYFNIMSIILFISTTLFIITNRDNKYKKYRKDIKIIFIFIIILINLICSKVIWTKVPKILLSIQFPWRLLVFLSLLIALYSPIVLLNKKISTKTKNILISLLIIIITFEGLNNIDYYTEEECSVGEALNSTIGMGFQYEYLVENDLDFNYYFDYGKNYFQIREYEVIPNNQTTIEITNDDFPDLVFEVSNLQEKTKIELPRIYYLGYKLKDEFGNKIDLYNNEIGFLEAEISKNGTYNLKYEKTKYHKIAECIRCLTIIIIVIYLSVRVVKWKRKKLQY